MRPLAAALLHAAFFTRALAAEPSVGDTRAAVEAELGAPTATRNSGDTEISIYERGTVTYRDGRASALKLVAAEEWLRRVEREKTAAETARRRLAEAAAARDAMLADKAFPLLSTSGRIERVEALLAAHPQADVAHLLHDLRRTLADETEAKRLAETADRARIAQARQVASLTGRLEEAERTRDSTTKALAEADRRISQLENDLTVLNGRMGVMEDLLRTRVVYPGGAPTTTSKTTLRTTGAAVTTATSSR